MKTKTRQHTVMERIERGDGTLLKWCSKDQHWVEVNGFGRNSATTDGLQTYCRGCLKEYFKQRNRIQTSIRRAIARQRKDKEQLEFQAMVRRAKGDKPTIS